MVRFAQCFANSRRRCGNFGRCRGGPAPPWSLTRDPAFEAPQGAIVVEALEPDPHLAWRNMGRSGAFSGAPGSKTGITRAQLRLVFQGNCEALYFHGSTAHLSRPAIDAAVLPRTRNNIARVTTGASRWPPRLARARRCGWSDLAPLHPASRPLQARCSPKRGGMPQSDPYGSSSGPILVLAGSSSGFGACPRASKGLIWVPPFHRRPEPLGMQARRPG